MGELREIVDLKQIDRLLLAAAVLLPILGAAVGAFRSQKTSAKGALKQGLMWGSLGPLTYALWRMYSALTARSGLDSLSNLLVNLVLFIAIGMGTGWLFGRNRPQKPERNSAENQNSETAQP